MTVWYNWSGSVISLPGASTKEIGRVKTNDSGSLAIFDLHYDGEHTYETSSIVWFTNGGDYTNKADIITYEPTESYPQAVIDTYIDVDVTTTSFGSIKKHEVTEVVTLPINEKVIWIGIRNITNEGTCNLIIPIPDLGERVGAMDFRGPDTDTDGGHIETPGLLTGDIAAIVVYDAAN